jgi:hypothetical protein
MGRSLENKMKNRDIFNCEIIESKMNGIRDKINQTVLAIEGDPLCTELRIMDWISYQFCSKEIEKVEMI